MFVKVAVLKWKASNNKVLLNWSSRNFLYIYSAIENMNIVYENERVEWNK